MLWELFGLRVWHADDMAHIDADIFDDYVRVAKSVHDKRSKE